MRVLSQVDLSGWHTLAAKALARELRVLESPEELNVLTLGDHILGGGSNTLFVGEVEQRLIHPAWGGVRVEKENRAQLWLYAAAGENWNDVAAFTVAQGWYGLENLAAIPGCVGAAPVQNIGAYGVECESRLAEIEVFDRQSKETYRIHPQDCDFHYRSSRFKHEWKSRYLITGVVFLLHKQGRLQLDYGPLASLAHPPDSPQQLFEEITRIRRSKLPDPEVLPNAGSFFHNPILTKDEFAQLQTQFPEIPHFPAGVRQVKIPAAWLIEQCGFKGAREGPVGIYDKHALVLTNQGGSGEAILRFARRVQHAVFEKFSVTLAIEPIIIGEKHG